MEAHVTKGRTGKRTITVITTTWTMRWWDGYAWIEQTLGPSVEIVGRGETTSSPDEAAYDAVPELQNPHGSQRPINQYQQRRLSHVHPDTHTRRIRCGSLSTLGAGAGGMWPGCAG
jgi:hypothetical protein